MIKKQVMVLVLAILVPLARGSEFADEVIEYDPGIGYAAGFTNALACLGEPSRINPFGEATDPFDPPYGKNQILSLGAGGSLTVSFDTPILNHPHNLFGLDFTIFGNSGFIITNDFDLTTFDWVGTPATDGSLFAQNTGATRVSVSRDGVSFFEVEPATAGPVDYLFPTDASGDFQIPVRPAVVQDDFVGLTLDQIRAVYNGSAGGTSYDISTARDENGVGVFLPEVRFVRVEVLSGKSEIDGFAKVARVSPGQGRR